MKKLISVLLLLGLLAGLCCGAAFADGHIVQYDLHFKKPVSFKALALCMKDKGAEYTLDWAVHFFDNTP